MEVKSAEVNGGRRKWLKIGHFSLRYFIPVSTITVII
jgi:hypothetical protein